MKNLDKVWETYSKTKDPEIKNKLILEYAHIVKYVAGRLSTRIGRHVDFDDLESYGIFGLIDAIDKFDYKKGVKFETYASLRIRGEIIDNIRRLDWVPRSLRQKNKELEKTYSGLENKLGREPTNAEIADELNMSESETAELIQKSSVASLISLDDYMEQNYDQGFEDDEGYDKSPEGQYDKQELKDLLIKAIDSLTDREKKVVTLYYYEDLTLKEISKIMEVSESRISQIHSKAVLKLNSKLGKHKALLLG